MGVSYDHIPPIEPCRGYLPLIVLIFCVYDKLVVQIVIFKEDVYRFHHTGVSVSDFITTFPDLFWIDGH